jgi:hypothetical protein
MNYTAQQRIDKYYASLHEIAKQKGEEGLLDSTLFYLAGVSDALRYALRMEGEQEEDIAYRMKENKE